MESSANIENPQNKVVPRRIEGMDKVTRQESSGGNAGENRVAVNAYYAGAGDEEFIFSNRPQDFGGRDADVTFIVDRPFQQWLKAMKEGKVPVPALILDVLGSGDREFFRRRALEHNAFEIKSFIEAGGKIEDLPPTPLMPPPESFAPGQ